jgi:hypothetical protein
VATEIATEETMEHTVVLADSSSLSAKPSHRRYTFIEYENGFRIEGRERAPVEVRLSPNQTFLIVSDGRDHPPCIYTSMNIYAYRQLLKVVVDILMQEWMPPLEKPYWSGAYLWAINKAQQGLHYYVYPQWQRLLTIAPEQKRLVAKSVFAATFDYNRLGGEIWDEIYEQPFLVKDIIQYRAAAIACHYAIHLAGEAWLSAYFHTVTAKLNQEGLYHHYHPGSLDGEDDAFHKRLAIELLRNDWKIFFSRDEKAGKSLCRTLMNLPGGMNGSLLCKLPDVSMWLNRPITDRVELLTFLLFADKVSDFALPDDATWVATIYAKARREEIIAALRILSKHLRRDLHTRRKDIAELVNYIHDYSHYVVGYNIQPHRGNLVGLVEKAIEWHRQINQRTITRYLTHLDGKTTATLPPITLPTDSAITFLASAEAIFNEGASMGHCIATYAETAVRGQCYLFHVDYQNTQASVMVDIYGKAVQSYGPHNTITPASEYGARMLSAWGIAFPPPETSTFTRFGDFLRVPIHEIDYHPF